MMMKKRETIAILLFAVLGLSVPSYSSVIGVNFAGNDVGTGIDSSDYNLASSLSAGVVAQVNWNNIRLATGTTTDIVGPIAGKLADNAGINSGVSITWAADGEARVARAGVSSQGDNVLMNGYLDDQSEGGDVTVTFGNLSQFSTAGYDVYVYFGAGTDNRNGTLSNGATTYDFNTSSSIGYVFPSDYAQVTSTDSSFPDGNYALFAGLTNDNFTVIYERGSGNGGIHAIQIVAHVPVSPSDLLAINFSGNDAGTGVDPADYRLAANLVAGVVAQTNWNNALGLGGLLENVTDGAGAESGVSITWAADGEGRVARAGVSSQGDNVLMNGYLDDTLDSGDVTVSVSNLNQYAGEYDVYVYVGAGADNRRGFMSNGATTYGFKTWSSTNQNFPGSYLQAANPVLSDPANFPPGNYAVFPSMTIDNFTITYQRENANGGIHGIQVVKTADSVVESSLATGDGLSLTWGNSELLSVNFLGQGLSGAVAPGGFSFMDYNTASSFTRFAGTLESNVYTAVNDGLSLQTLFVETNDYIEAEVMLESVSGVDRAVWLEFRLPLDSGDWTWWDSINEKRAVNAQELTLPNSYRPLYDVLKPEFRTAAAAPFYTPCENRIVPFAVAANSTAGVAMAIPPTNPINFISGCDDSGLYFRWPIGLTAGTSKFPSQAKLKFRIYPVDPKDGLRDALDKYYDWFSEYYSVDARELERYKSRGWAYSGIPERAGPYIARNQGDDGYIAYFNLKGLARDLFTAEEAPLDEVILSNAEYDARLSDPSVTFQWDADSSMGQEIFASSRPDLPDGSYYAWKGDGDDLLYPLNPDPDLVVTNASGESLMTQGQYMFSFFTNLNETTAFHGTHIDMAGNWANYMDFREDHFAAADHPLTFDLSGNVGLHLKMAFYEFFDAVRTYGKTHDFGNEPAGMKMLSMKGKEQSTSVPGIEQEGTRFFNAALVDSSWHEGSVDGGDGLSAWNKYDVERMFMGRKLYRITSGSMSQHNAAILSDGDPSNDHLLEPRREQVEHVLASSVAYGFPTTLETDYFVDVDDYEYDPIVSQYHFRDADLWARYEPVNDLMVSAGWEPLTHATVSLTNTVCERFGDAPPYYFSLWNQSTSTTVRISIDLAELGVATDAWNLREIVWRSALQNVSVDGNSVLHADAVIGKDKSYVIRLANEDEPERPTPLDPADGTVVATATPLLTWNWVPGASGYQVRLTDFADGSELFYLADHYYETVQLPGNLTLESYHNYELAIAANGVADSSWETAQFTVILPPPDNSMVAFDADFNASPAGLIAKTDLGILNAGTAVGSWVTNELNQGNVMTNVSSTGDMMLKVAKRGLLGAQLDHPVDLAKGGVFSFDFRPDVTGTDRWVELMGRDTLNQLVFRLRLSVSGDTDNYAVTVFYNTTGTGTADGLFLGNAVKFNSGDADEPMNSISIHLLGDTVTVSGQNAYGLDWEPVQTDVLTPGAANLNSIQILGQPTDKDTFMLFDNFRMVELQAPDPLLYGSWAVENGLIGAPAALHVDADEDGLNNLVEYAFGGFPNLGTDPNEILPVSQLWNDGGEPGFEYIYRRRTDADARKLTYTLRETDDLVSGMWSNVSDAVINTVPIDGTLETVTNRIPISGEISGFFKLDVSVDAAGL